MGRQDSGHGPGSALLYFFMGGVIGAGVALLAAPKTGQETRKMVRDFTNDARDKAGNYVGQLKDKASGYVDKGKEIVERKKTVLSTPVEEDKGDL